jgi:hypothetical protein
MKWWPLKIPAFLDCDGPIYHAIWTAFRMVQIEEDEAVVVRRRKEY